MRDLKVYHYVKSDQCSTICGAIEDRSISLKAIDERVFTNFRDKNAVFTNFRDKNAVFTHFRDKNAVFTHFCVKNLWFHKYVTICLTRASTDAFRSCFVINLSPQVRA